jgi:tRNA(Ile)-lysidine synthase
MLEQIHSILQNNCKLKTDLPVVVGVSGGPDSLCLLDVLWQFGYPLVVAHLDHGLRSESAAEAQMVEQHAHRIGARFVFERVDVAAYASQEGFTIEEAARSARYLFLFEQARIHQAQAVAVGHTANDQVETVLMHLMRGAGLSGLRGMSAYNLPNAWSQVMPLVRPLLSTWRAEILTYLAQRGLQPNIDPSNQDTRYYRNRLRHELLPFLENLNPGVSLRLWQMADILHEEDEVLDSAASQAWQLCLSTQGEGYIAFDALAFADQPKSLQRRLARMAIARLRPGQRDIGYETIERMLEFLHMPTRTNLVDLAAGLNLVLEGGCLWLVTHESDLPVNSWPQLETGFEQLLEIPTLLSLPGDWQLSIEFLPASPELKVQAISNPDPYQIWLDADELSLPLHLRTRLPGEHFRPLGMAGHSLKLSDFMVNVHIPRRARQNWPLVACANEVAWVPGYRCAEPFAISVRTQRLLRIALKPVSINAGV